MDAVRKVQQLLGFFLCKVKGINQMSHQQPSFPYGVSENKENDGYFAKTSRIPRLFNAKSRCVCRNRRYFRLFRYTLVKRCHARGRHTFGKYVQTGNAAKLAANLAYYIIPARQIKPINPQKCPLFLRQFYKSGQNARQSRCSLYRTFTSWWLNSSWTASKISASQPTQAKAKPR